MVAARMMLIELVGPKTRWCEEVNSAPTKPPTITHMITMSGGRPAIRAKPIACGMETSETVAPAIRSWWMALSSATARSSPAVANQLTVRARARRRSYSGAGITATAR